MNALVALCEGHMLSHSTLLAAQPALPMDELVTVVIQCLPARMACNKSVSVQGWQRSCNATFAFNAWEWFAHIIILTFISAGPI